MLSVTGLLVVLVVSGCATQQKTDFQEVYDSKKHLFKEQKEPVEFQPRDIHPRCDKTTKTCIVTEDDMNILLEDSYRAEDIIIELNHEVQELRSGYNSLVNALIECEYGKAQRDQTIEYQDQQAFREQLISTGKQVVLAGICALLLQ